MEKNKISSLVLGRAQGLGTHPADQSAKADLLAVASKLEEIEGRRAPAALTAGEERLLQTWARLMYRS